MAKYITSKLLLNLQVIPPAVAKRKASSQAWKWVSLKAKWAPRGPGMLLSRQIP